MKNMFGTLCDAQRIQTGSCDTIGDWNGESSEPFNCEVGRTMFVARFELLLHFEVGYHSYLSMLGPSE